MEYERIKREMMEKIVSNQMFQVEVDKQLDKIAFNWYKMIHELQRKINTTEIESSI